MIPACCIYWMIEIEILAWKTIFKKFILLILKIDRFIKTFLIATCVLCRDTDLLNTCILIRTYYIEYYNGYRTDICSFLAKTCRLLYFAQFGDVAQMHVLQIIQYQWVELVLEEFMQN